MAAARLMLEQNRADAMRGLVAALAAMGFGVALSMLVDDYPLVLFGFAVLSLACVWALSFGWLGVASVLTATLPWLIVFGSILPHLVKTVAAACAAAAILALVLEHRGPRQFPRAWVVGVVLLLIPTVFSLFGGTTGLGRIQAVKYLVFPALVLAITTSQRTHTSLGRVRSWVLLSTVGALAVHALIISVGYGAIGTYYGLGERLGFVESPHELAFLAAGAAAAGLTLIQKSLHRTAAVSLSASVVLLTGVRAGALALVIIALFVIQSRRQASYVIVILVTGFVLVISGATDVLTNRFTESQASGEFASISTAGSSRGTIWTHALSAWVNSGPYHWVLGTGLREIKQISAQTIGVAYVGHSDVVEVLVELGVFGLLGLILLWVALARARTDPLVLIVLLTFAVVNGSIEWLAPMTVTLLLSHRDQRQPIPFHAYLSRRKSHAAVWRHAHSAPT